jgi:hypothetical protein
MAAKSVSKVDVVATAPMATTTTTTMSATPAAAPAPAAPALLPCKVEVEAPEPKRAAKRARKEPVGPSDAPAGGATATVPAPRTKKVVEATAPPTEGEAAAVEGEKANEPSNWLVVAKTVRSLLKAHPASMHCGSDALPALNSKVSEIINEAIGRALANGRKTLKNSDF